MKWHRNRDQSLDEQLAEEGWYKLNLLPEHNTYEKALQHINHTKGGYVGTHEIYVREEPLPDGSVKRQIWYRIGEIHSPNDPKQVIKPTMPLKR